MPRDNDSKLHVIFMQGTAGSGKSTEARRRAEAYEKETGEKAEIVSADQFFDKIGGYVRARASEAFSYCLREYIECLQDEVPLVIVDNPNTSMSEIGPYGTIARAYGYKVTLVRTVCPLQLAVDRSTHNVPHAVVELQNSKIAKFVPPREWHFETVSAF